MARDTHSARKPAGPGRKSRRPRTGKGLAQQTIAQAAAPVAQVVTRAARRMPRPKRPFHVTRRALVFAAVLVIMALSFAGSLRVYLVQAGELAAARAEIEANSARIAELTSELERWNDPAYVQAQARQRLGWVMPGEVGYRVIGRDGKVLTGGVEIRGVGSSVPNGLEPRWWDHLAGSVNAADEPEPARG